MATVFATAAARAGTIILAISNINKRVDKTVELTGAEKKLEEEYESSIRLLTG